MKPSKHERNKVIVVPTTVEEKFVHDNSFDEEFDQAGVGDGNEQEGDVIGEQPIKPQQDGEGEGPGGDGGDSHEIESNNYELGKILTEKFELPNLKDKGKKCSLVRFKYDMTDKNKGFGQFLDKKSTLKQIIKTNIGLEKVNGVDPVNTEELIVSPKDRVYRTLSREREYESQAMVFFIRDYSGSMHGNVTSLVVAQHVMIYSWLLYQYAKRVETRFILHDTQAKEVEDFYTYYNSKVAGGTKVSSGYNFVNEIVEKESLAKDYNIYVFHGTDGDDWDTSGTKTMPELEKMLQYTSRMGLSIIKHGYSGGGFTEMERYIKSDFLRKYKNEFRMDVMTEDSKESRLIDGIKKLLEGTQ
jgi:uncharacterized sporulation protein YeaH/YhbH (DUF444 family)